MKKRKRLRGLFIYILMIVIIFASPANVSKAATSQKLVYAGKTVNYKKYSVKYSINGKNIKQNKTKGVILNNNAMGYYVDVVKKGLKAECVYDKTAKKLTITKFENTIELTMDSKVAYVNGKKKKMSFPMTKVKYADKGISRIMVPVRFVAENLGYKYTWNSSSKTGTITYSWLEYYDNNSWIKYTGTKVKVSYNGENISYGKMPGIILDSTVLLNAKKVFGNELGMDYVYDATNQTVTISDGLVTAIYTIGSKDVIVNGEVMSASVPVMRIMNQQDSKYYVMVPANFTANIFGYNYNWNRKTSTSEISDKEIVVENNTSAATGASIYFSLPSGVDQNSLIDEDLYWKNQFTITIPGDYIEYYNTQAPVIANSIVIDSACELTAEGNTKLTFTTSKLQGYKMSVLEGYVWITVGEPKDIYKNIVVLDAGHGGTDPGAQAGGYKEKDITYSIIYTYAKEYFNQPTSNVKVYWSRYDDTFVSLSDRAVYASKIGADLFVSLHMNSATSTTAQGAESYYCVSNNKTLSNGINSKIMAEMYQKALVDVLGMKSRGVKTANYYVIKNNTVPAVLLELGFISNSSDRSKLSDPEFQKSTAEQIYQVTENIFAQYPTGR